MTPTPNLPTISGGLLEDLYRVWDLNGWDRRDLAAFRMADDDDTDDDDDADDGDGDDDSDGDDKDDKKGNGTDRRVAQARTEAARRRRELKPWKDLGKEFNLTPEQMREQLAKSKKPPAKADDDTDDKPDPEELRREVERDITAKANKRIIRSEVKALAAELFADPGDAPLYLDLTDYDVDDDGEVDEDQIVADLKDVLKRKPHLARSASDDADDGGKGARRSGGRLKPDRAQGKNGIDKPSVATGREMFEARRPKASSNSG